MLANDTRSEFFFKNHCCLRIDLKEKWNFRQTDWVLSPFGDFPPKINRWWPYLEKVLQLHIVYYLLLVHFYSNPAADYVHKILTLPLVYEQFWKERLRAANFFLLSFWVWGGRSFLIFPLFPTCSLEFPLGSHQVPNMFPIAPRFNPVRFAQSRFLLKTTDQQWSYQMPTSTLWMSSC
jgi:hypothetical protein